MTFDFTDDDRDTLRVLPSTPDAVLIAIGSRRQEPRVSDVRVPLDRVEEVVAGIWDAARTAAARQTTGQDDTKPAPWIADGRHGPTPAEMRQAIARAIHRYDNQHALSGNDIPSKHHYGEADAVLAVLAAPAVGQPAEPRPPAVPCGQCGARWSDSHGIHASDPCKPVPAVGQPAEAHDTDAALTPHGLLLDVLAHTSSAYLDENFAPDEELGNIADYLLKLIREESLREAMNDLCAFGHGEAAAFLLRKTETVEGER